MPVEWSEKIVVVELADEPALSDELLSVLERLEQADRPPNVVLNFANVSYINSSNIAQLLRIRKALEGAGQRLRLCSVSDEIWSVLTITGLDKLFQFAPDPMTALAGIQLEEDQDEG